MRMEKLDNGCKVTHISDVYKRQVELANTMRRKLMAYPEVRQVMSQTGRPNDGTDATGFYNICLLYTSRCV